MVKDKLNIVINGLNKKIGSAPKETLKEIKRLAVKLDALGRLGPASTITYSSNKKIKLAAPVKYDGNKKDLPG